MLEIILNRPPEYCNMTKDNNIKMICDIFESYLELKDEKIIFRKEKVKNGSYKKYLFVEQNDLNLVDMLREKHIIDVTRFQIKDNLVSFENKEDSKRFKSNETKILEIYKKCSPKEATENAIEPSDFIDSSLQQLVLFEMKNNGNLSDLKDRFNREILMKKMETEIKNNPKYCPLEKYAFENNLVLNSKNIFSTNPIQGHYITEWELKKINLKPLHIATLKKGHRTFISLKSSSPSTLEKALALYFYANEGHSVDTSNLDTQNCLMVNQKNFLLQFVCGEKIDDTIPEENVIFVYKTEDNYFPIFEVLSVDPKKEGYYSLFDQKKRQENTVEKTLLISKNSSTPKKRPKTKTNPSPNKKTKSKTNPSPNKKTKETVTPTIKTNSSTKRKKENSFSKISKKIKLKNNPTKENQNSTKKHSSQPIMTKNISIQLNSFDTQKQKIPKNLKKYFIEKFDSQTNLIQKMDCLNFGRKEMRKEKVIKNNFVDLESGKIDLDNNKNIDVSEDKKIKLTTVIIDKDTLFSDLENVINGKFDFGRLDEKIKELEKFESIEYSGCQLTPSTINRLIDRKGWLNDEVKKNFNKIKIKIKIK